MGLKMLKTYVLLCNTSCTEYPVVIFLSSLCTLLLNIIIKSHCFQHALITMYCERWHLLCMYIYIYINVYTYDCCCENPCYHISFINTFQFYCPMAFISHWYELSSVIIFSCCSNIILQYFSNIMSHMFIHYCFYPCHVEQHRSVIAGYLGIFHLYVVVHPRNRKWFMNPIYIHNPYIYVRVVCICICICVCVCVCICICI